MRNKCGSKTQIGINVIWKKAELYAYNLKLLHIVLRRPCGSTAAFIIRLNPHYAKHTQNNEWYHIGSKQHTAVGLCK